MGLLGIQLELVAEAMHGLGLVSCDSETKIRQHYLWMIPIIIHNFFPSAAELLAGLVLFACRFDACYIALCSPRCPSHTNSHIISPLFSLLLCSFLFSIFLMFHHLDLSQSPWYFVSLSYNGQLTIEWRAAHTMKCHSLCYIRGPGFMTIHCFTKAAVEEWVSRSFFQWSHTQSDSQSKPTSTRCSHVDISICSHVKIKLFVEVFSNDIWKKRKIFKQSLWGKKGFTDLPVLAWGDCHSHPEGCLRSWWTL